MFYLSSSENFQSALSHSMQECFPFTSFSSLQLSPHPRHNLRNRHHSILLNLPPSTRFVLQSLPSPLLLSWIHSFWSFLKEQKMILQAVEHPQSFVFACYFINFLISSSFCFEISNFFCASVRVFVYCRVACCWVFYTTELIVFMVSYSFLFSSFCLIVTVWGIVSLSKGSLIWSTSPLSLMKSWKARLI